MNPVELLRKAVLAEGSQAAVAAKIHYSPAVVSQILKGTYPGSTDAVYEAINTVYGGKTMQPAIPDGFMQNAVGDLVSIKNIKEIDLARDEFVRQLTVKAKAFSESLQRFKDEIRDDFQAFIELSAERYNASVGGQKGNVGLKTFDGKMEVKREVNDLIEFDERLHIAKALVDECLREWTKGLDTKILALIESAFQVDKKGKVNTKRVLGLRKLKIDDPKWQQAMQAIDDAINITGSSTYFRFYERDAKGKPQQIQLDFSGV